MTVVTLHQSAEWPAKISALRDMVDGDARAKNHERCTTTWVWFPYQLEQQTLRAWTWPLWRLMPGALPRLLPQLPHCHTGLVPDCWCWFWCHTSGPGFVPHLWPYLCDTLHPTLCAILMTDLERLPHILCQQTGWIIVVFRSIFTFSVFSVYVVCKCMFTAPSHL